MCGFSHALFRLQTLKTLLLRLHRRAADAEATNLLRLGARLLAESQGPKAVWLWLGESLRQSGSAAPQRVAPLLEVARLTEPLRWLSELELGGEQNKLSVWGGGGGGRCVTL